MTPLGKLGSWRHLVVGGTIGATTLAAGLGIIGEDHAERFDSKQVVVSPVGSDGLHIREVVDEDFGNHRRHGYERSIPNDFGVPADVTPNRRRTRRRRRRAGRRRQTRIRIGDPGTHDLRPAPLRPRVHAAGGTSSTRASWRSTSSAPTRRWRRSVRDRRHRARARGPDVQRRRRRAVRRVRRWCPTATTYRAVDRPARARATGVTIGGTIVGRTPVVDVPAAIPSPTPQPNRRAAGRGQCRPRDGGRRRRVRLGSPARPQRGVRRRCGRCRLRRAAAGPLRAAPGIAARRPRGDAVRALGPDDDMDELATTEFVPPTGHRPVAGHVLLRERIDDDTVGAWFSGQAADDVIAISKDDDDDVVLRRGPRSPSAGGRGRAILARLFAGGDDGHARRLRQGLRHGVAGGRRRRGASDRSPLGLLEALRSTAAAVAGVSRR